MKAAAAAEQAFSLAELHFGTQHVGEGEAVDEELGPVVDDGLRPGEDGAVIHQDPAFVEQVPAEGTTAAGARTEEQQAGRGVGEAVAGDVEADGEGVIDALQLHGAFVAKGGTAGIEVVALEPDQTTGGDVGDSGTGPGKTGHGDRKDHPRTIDEVSHELLRNTPATSDPGWCGSQARAA